MRTGEENRTVSGASRKPIRFLLAVLLCLLYLLCFSIPAGTGAYFTDKGSAAASFAFEIGKQKYPKGSTREQEEPQKQSSGKSREAPIPEQGTLRLPSGAGTASSAQTAPASSGREAFASAAEKPADRSEESSSAPETEQAGGQDGAQQGGVAGTGPAPKAGE